MQDEVKVSQADIECAIKIQNCQSSNFAAHYIANYRHQAERETLARMEPVAWMYERGGVKHVVTERATDLPAFVAVGWTETPLFALPPAPEAGQ